MPRNIAVRGLVGHTFVCESELGVIVGKSVLAGQDKTFATLFLRVGYSIREHVSGILRRIFQFF